MLVLMAGLPATGKSALSIELSRRTGAIRLCKDAIRAALFPPHKIDYSGSQDDLCMETIYRVAEYLLALDPSEMVIIDGRTFSRMAQVDVAAEVARRSRVPMAVLRCVASEETARARLESEAGQGLHPARNRDFGLYVRLSQTMEPFDRPHLELRTDRMTLDECVERALQYLKEIGLPKR